MADQDSNAVLTAACWGSSVLAVIAVAAAVTANRHPDPVASNQGQKEILPNLAGAGKATVLIDELAETRKFGTKQPTYLITAYRVTLDEAHKTIIVEAPVDAHQICGAGQYADFKKAGVGSVCKVEIAFNAMYGWYVINPEKKFDFDGSSWTLDKTKLATFQAAQNERN